MRMPLVALRPYFAYLRRPRPHKRTPRRRALGLGRGVAAAVGDERKSTGSWCGICRCGDVFAGDVVLLWYLNHQQRVWRIVFLVPFVDVLRSNKPCITVLQIITLSGLRFFIFHKVILSSPDSPLRTRVRS